MITTENVAAAFDEVAPRFLGEPLTAVSHWLNLLLAADLIYLTAGILTFDFILEG